MRDVEGKAQRFTVTIRDLDDEVTADDVHEGISGQLGDDSYPNVDVQKVELVRRSQAHHRTVHYNIVDVS